MKYIVKYYSYINIRTRKDKHSYYNYQKLEFNTFKDCEYLFYSFEDNNIVIYYLNDSDSENPFIDKYKFPVWFLNITEPFGLQSLLHAKQDVFNNNDKVNILNRKIGQLKGKIKNINNQYTDEYINKFKVQLNAEIKNLNKELLLLDEKEAFILSMEDKYKG